MIRVLVLADSAVVRAGLQAMLHEDGRFDPVLAELPLTQLFRTTSQKFGADPNVVLAEITGKRLFSLSIDAESSKSLPLKDLRGSFSTTTPSKSFDIKVAAEDNPTISQPSGPEIFHGGVQTR